MDDHERAHSILHAENVHPYASKEAWLAAEFAAVRAEERERCATEVDGLAFCEECHDCYDDLVRSAPYRRAAKYLRDNAAAIRAMKEDQP